MLFYLSKIFGIRFALQHNEFMISNMSSNMSHRFTRLSVHLGMICALMIACTSPALVFAQSSKPAPKGTPPRVIVPKSDREKPRDSESKDERPKRP